PHPVTAVFAGSEVSQGRRLLNGFGTNTKSRIAHDRSPTVGVGWWSEGRVVLLVPHTDPDPDLEQPISLGQGLGIRCEAPRVGAPRAPAARLPVVRYHPPDALAGLVHFREDLDLHDGRVHHSSGSEVVRGVPSAGARPPPMSPVSVLIRTFVVSYRI